MSDLLATDKEDEKKDIFDLFSIDDIPADIAEGINTDVFAKRIIELLKLAGRPLSVDELTVGFYRKYKDEEDGKKTKRQVTLKAYNMSKEDNPSIKSVENKKGVYELI